MSSALIGETNARRSRGDLRSQPRRGRSPAPDQDTLSRSERRQWRGGEWGFFLNPRGVRVRDKFSRIYSSRLECFGASLARPRVAQELAAQVIGVRRVAPPGSPFGVDREIIGQLPSGVCVATRKSTPRLIFGFSAV